MSLVKLRKLLLLLTLMLLPVSGWGATYYISPTGNDTTGDGSAGTPWKTTTTAFAAISAGDTLILKDGTYDYVGGNITNPPSGSAGNYTIIKAENDWGAILTGYSSAIDMTSKSYVQIEGLKLKDLTGDGITLKTCDHAKLLRLSVKNGSAYNARYSGPVQFSEDSHHILLEDCFLVGAMRYGVLIYESYNVILRRVVIRFDGNSEREPKAGVCFYGKTGGITGAYDSMAQNCIVLDFNSCGGLGGGITNAHSGINIGYYGCIALNLPTNGYLINEDAESADNSVIDSIAWDDSEAGFVTRNTTLVDSTTISGCTGAIAGRLNGYANWGDSYNVTVKNSIFYNNTLANNGSDIDDYNLYFPSNLKPAGATNALTSDPLIKYIVRVETDSPAYQSGEAGVDRGANVLKQYGVSGTLWGEEGYNTLTATDLWPWLYEDQIKADFSEADSFEYPELDWEGNPLGIVNNEARGFCTGTSIGGYPQTLTRYIWEYLGNEIPSTIYGDTPATTTKTFYGTWRGGTY